MAKKKIQLSVMEQLANSPTFRSKVFQKLVDHIISGYSLDCFVEIGKEGILKCFELYPLEFKTELYETALRHGKKNWEDIGKKQATGHCLGNSRAWVYNMINRYNWSDKLQVDANVKGQVAVQVVNYSPVNEAPLQ